MGKTGGRRRNHRSAEQQVIDVENVAKSLALRRAGSSYDEIAKELGLCNRGAAFKMVHRGFDSLLQEPAAEVLKIELERLDAMLAGLMRTGAVDGNPQAVNAAIKIMDRRAKYLGLDAPAHVELTGKNGGPVAMVTLDDVDTLSRTIAANSLDTPATPIDIH